MTGDEQMIGFLQRLVQCRTDSGDHDSHRALQAIIADWLHAAVPHATITQGPAAEFPWTLITTGSTVSPMLLFACHVDTVPVGDLSKWVHPPFSAHIADGRMYGRGTTDMKGGMAAAASALIEAGKLGKHVGLLLTSDEEIGSLGAWDASTALAGLDVKAIIIPEATKNRIVLGHRGALWLRILCKGLAAHGSTPERGINAALKLSHAVLRAEEKLPLSHEVFFGKETWNLGTFMAGTAPNIVPELAEAIIDMRITGDGAALHDWWKEQPEVATVETILSLAPLRSDILPPIIFEGMDIDDSPAPYFTDGSVLSTVLPGVPVMIWGPGSPAQMHALDEYVDLRSILTAADLYRQVIDRWH